MIDIGRHLLASTLSLFLRSIPLSVAFISPGLSSIQDFNSRQHPRRRDPFYQNLSYGEYSLGGVDMLSEYFPSSEFNAYIMMAFGIGNTRRRNDGINDILYRYMMRMRCYLDIMEVTALYFEIEIRESETRHFFSAWPTGTVY
jgi:hypothetical protein